MNPVNLGITIGIARILFSFRVVTSSASDALKKWPKSKLWDKSFIEIGCTWPIDRSSQWTEICEQQKA